MASSYSTDLKLELMVTGEAPNTWGDKTNTNWNLIQQAVSGYQSIALTSTTTTLAMTNATISNARNMVLEFTGTLTGNSTVNLPDGIEKIYFIKDSTVHGTSNTLTFKTTSGSGVALTSGKITGAYSNGTDITAIDLSNLGGTMTIDQVLTYGSTTTQSLTVGNLIATTNISTNTFIGTNATVATVSCVTLTGATNNDSKGELRLVPLSTATSTYTITATDHGKCISTSSNVIIAPSIFSAGQNVTIFNSGTTNITITQSTSVTMYQVGTANTGNRTLSQKGLATAYCVASNTFVITGGGLS
jgi:hypothetical protein